MIPRGLRNKNPLNIRHSADTFQGEIEGTDKAFKTFSTLPWGYRAAFVILATYNKRGLDTIDKIITHWAPSNENDTASYISAVEKYSGVHRYQKLTLSDGGDYIMIVSAMSFVENGRNACINLIRSGFYLQNKIKWESSISVFFA